MLLMEFFVELLFLSLKDGPIATNFFFLSIEIISFFLPFLVEF